VSKCILHVLLDSKHTVRFNPCALPFISNMTQPAQGQGLPTILKSEEIGPMSGPEPETTTTADEEENIDSDKDVQVRSCTMHATAGTRLLHWMWRRVASIADFITRCFASFWYRLDLGRQRNSRKREMIYSVVASGTKRCNVIGTAWLDFQREETRCPHHHQHRRHRHGLQPPMMQEIHLHPWLRERSMVPPQMPKIKANPPIVSTPILPWSANVQKRGAFSIRISRRAT
jgi:hypothetical protein